MKSNGSGSSNGPDLGFKAPKTGLSNQDDHYSIESGKAQGTPVRPAISNQAMRSGRGMKASQPSQVKSKGDISDARLS